MRIKTLIVLALLAWPLSVYAFIGGGGSTTINSGSGCSTSGTGIQKGNGSGGCADAAAGSDYQAASTAGSTGNPMYYNAAHGIGPVANVVHAGSGTLATAFSTLGSHPGTVIADPGQTYTVSSPLIWGTVANDPQTLLVDGATVQCTNTGGVGHGCLVVGNYGKLIGSNRINSSVTASSPADIDALVESYTAYEYSTSATQFQQANMDVEHIGISPGDATIEKAAFWISGIDGDGFFNDIFVGPSTATSIPAGILIDDAPTGSAYTDMFWNNLVFHDVWVGIGTDVHGVEVLCGATSGSSGSNLTWNGGAITDGRSTTLDNLDINGGSGGNCTAEIFNAPYFESFTGQTGNYIDLTGAQAFRLSNTNFEGPTLTDCVSIGNASADQVHVDGRGSTNCTNFVVNAVTGQTLTVAQSGSIGAFNYDWTNPSNSTGVINQVGGLVNPFGPGGPAGIYYSAAGTALPACAAAYKRYFACVSDSTLCTSGTTYVSGGSTSCMVQCNNAGSAWKETGVQCF